MPSQDFDANHAAFLLELLTHFQGGPTLFALEVADESMTKLRRDDPLIPMGSDCLAYQMLGEVITVALGSVHQVDTQFAGAFQ